MNMNELRSGFKAYMQKRFPNDSNISSTISMAFFLERYGDDFDIDFRWVLTEKVIPDLYKQKLEEHFITRGIKDPRSNAFIYERSLRLLLQYLDGRPLIIQQNSNKKGKESNERELENPENGFIQITKKDVNTAYEVYVRGHYDRAEKLLHSILSDTLFKYNADERVVAMKIGLIDTLYSTNLNKGQSTTSLPELASTIACPKLRFDERIFNGDISVIVDILQGARNNFSFVSKYCKIHEYYLSETDCFTIYDSVVSKNLFRFLPRYDGVILREHTPYNNCFQKRNYALWCDYINKVIEINGLQDVEKIKRKLDWYIWGKFNRKSE